MDVDVVLNAEKQARARDRKQETVKVAQKSIKAAQRIKQITQRNAAVKSEKLAVAMTRADINRPTCPLAFGQSDADRAADLLMLDNAKYDAASALIAYWQRAGNDQCPELAKLDNNTATMQDVETIRQHILSEKFTTEDQMRIIADWYHATRATNLSVDRHLYACGCCGVRDLTSQYTSINLRHELDQLHEAEVAELQERNPMADAPKRQKCKDQADATCAALELTGPEQDKYLALNDGQRKLSSVYACGDDHDGIRYYWVQPELVQMGDTVAKDDDTVSRYFERERSAIRVCTTCLDALAKHERPVASCAPLTDVFEERIEFGSWERTAAAFPECTPLTLVEKYLIAYVQAGPAPRMRHTHSVRS
jgi:hypothetical protein